MILAGGRIVADDSAEGLALRVAGESEVRWTRDGERFVHATTTPPASSASCSLQYGDEVEDLEVHRASLEDAYLTLVQQHESGRPTRPPAAFAEVATR